MKNEESAESVLRYIRTIPRKQFQGFWFNYVRDYIPDMGLVTASELEDDLLNYDLTFAIDRLDDVFYNYFEVKRIGSFVVRARRKWLKEFKNALESYITMETGIVTEMLPILEI